MNHAAKTLEVGSATIETMRYWVSEGSGAPPSAQRKSVTSSISEDGSVLDALATASDLRYENVIVLYPSRAKPEEPDSGAQVSVVEPKQIFFGRARIKMEGAGSFLSD